MGLFSSKKKTYVGTSVSRMVEDGDFMPSSQVGVLEYILSEGSSSNSLEALTLPDYLLRASANNIVAKSRRARNYANNPNNPFGVPESSLVSLGDVDLKLAIQTELLKVYPEGVTVQTAHFGPMNNYYFLKPMLENQYGYNYNTNELEDESLRVGFKCYMESAVLKYSQYSVDATVDVNYMEQYGLSAEAGYTPFRPANPSAKHVPWKVYSGDHDIAEVTVVYKDASGDKKSYLLTLDYLAFEQSSKPEDLDVLDDAAASLIDPNARAPIVEDTLDNQDYFQANYTYIENGVTKSDVFIYMYGAGYSELDNLFKSASNLGTHIPRMYARMNGQKYNDESLKDTPKYRAMVGLGRQYGINWSGWVDEIHDSVGSLKDVTQIFMTYSLPVNTEDPLIQRYMYEYFHRIYTSIPRKYETSAFKELSKDMISTGAKQGQTIVIKDKEYVQQVSFNSIGYIDVRGSIGEVGTVSSGRRDVDFSLGGRYQGLFEQVIGQMEYHWFRKQLTPTSYREIRIYGLSSSELVTGGKSTTASKDDEHLLIPLDMAMNDLFNTKEKEMLYTKSLYIVFNTLKTVKKKWYQTGIFKAIMVIVAITIAVVSVGAGAPISAYIMAAVVAVVQSVAISLVLQVAAKLLVSMGVDVGFAAAVVAVIAAIYGGYLALTKSTGVAGVTAKSLLQVSNLSFGLSSNGYAIQTQKAVNAYMSLMTDMTKELKEMTEKAQELGLGNHGPLLMFEPPISIGVRMGESVEAYYARSIHTHNIGANIYSLIENHVDWSLKLPTTEMILNNVQEKINEHSKL